MFQACALRVSIQLKLAPIRSLYSAFSGKALAISNGVTQSNTRDASQLLDEMPLPDSKTCNKRIRCYTSDHEHYASLSMFKRMLSAQLMPDSFALAATIKSAAGVTVLLDMGPAEAIHGFAMKTGYVVFAAVQKAMIDMYAKFGALCSSRRVFKEMDNLDSVAWNVLLTGYARAALHDQALHLFLRMHVCGVKESKPDAITLAVILPVIAKLDLLQSGQSIHGYAIKMGLEVGTLVGNALVSMYTKCGFVDDARRVFFLIPYKDIVSWNSLIGGCSQCGLFDDALTMISQMVSMNFLLNEITIVSILPVCAFLEDASRYGMEFHCYILRHGLDTDLSVCNALMMYYSRIGEMERAECVFGELDMRDLVTWNTMIAGYANNGWISKAFALLQLLLMSGRKPDSITLVSVLPLCTQRYDLEGGKRIHGYAFRHNLLYKETTLGNSIVDLYGKCGKLENALQTFEGIKEKDIVSWNVMLSAYVDNCRLEKFVNLLNQMNHEQIHPDSVTLLSVIQAGTLNGRRKVKEIHAYALRSGFVSLVTVGNAMLDAYTKCGDIEDAHKFFSSWTERNLITGNTMISGYLEHGRPDDAKMVFVQMSEKDVTTWNVMIQGHALYYCSDVAFVMFHQLQNEGLKPDSLSIMSILPACVRVASPYLIKQCHGYVIRTHLEDIYLVGTLLDSYAKCGSISDAYKLFQASSKKDLVNYTAMLSGYAMYGLADEAIRMFFDMLEANVKPDHVIMTALLSACSHAGLIDEGWKLFESMTENHGIRPTMEHYACMVDLLARRGRLREAYEFILDMPCEADTGVWGTLLGACKIHKEVEIGQLVAAKLFDAETENVGNYLAMSNIYAADGKWEGVEQVRRQMKTMDLKKPAGCSWIEIAMKRHIFVACDLSHPERILIYSMLRTLDQMLKEPLEII
ncbi:putative pentatricopeptide repeat-containing protein At5g08490 [Zingiber officinale]|uniref:Pentatricopeptide repeat-containing protein n=1 Tax=Zingiber officinale TaxID=94328 RepID=A0A8J5I7Y9_ZINOF|nr:putative pentatricopeptide repeat-containing protein At5g08490 [Zingiber officinale]KAG6529195.1 hypothetical protein ZIOFF_011391 [Zingiber officinale]